MSKGNDNRRRPVLKTTIDEVTHKWLLETADGGGMGRVIDRLVAIEMAMERREKFRQHRESATHR